MSDPSAVIAEVLCGKHFDGMHLNLNGGRLRWDSAFEISESALAALMAAGYAVVKLPESLVRSFAFQYPQRCTEETSRRGELVPCDKTAYAIALHEGRSQYPVCIHHARGKKSLVPLSEVVGALCGDDE